MSNEEKLILLKSMIGQVDDSENWTDDILLTYLDVAGQKILRRAYPYKDVEEVPNKYNALQCEIAIYLLNKRGAEGETSHSENGISRSYENADVPESMLSAVTPYCGVVI
jgi:hypothetical protein